MSFESELDEISRAAAGDRRAIARLVDRNSANVLGLATRMLGDGAEAEDVTQETFFRAWKTLPNWQPRARFSTWLHRVALNLCYDRLRKRREVTVEKFPDRADPALSPSELYEQKGRIQAVEAAIAALPPRQNAALTLCAIQGHSQNETAEIMEVSVEAVESLLARARRRLRTVLAEGDGR